jgi:hypothetical protein
VERWEEFECVFSYYKPEHDQHQALGTPQLQTSSQGG